jgi:fermentation-respiration switch protein FrsA (DUF1100 family)
MTRTHTRLRILLVLLIMAVVPALAPARGFAQQTVNCARDVTVRSGDTLSGLAANYLGDPLAYNKIIAANNELARTDDSYAAISDEGTIKIGWKLCIPVRGGTAGTGISATTSGMNAATSSRDPVETPELIGEHLTIDYLRQQKYPGSKLVIEETLDPGANYERYIASYLSEGIKINGLLTVPNGPKPASGWPVIIFNHGYIPPEVYRTTERYVAYVDAFARNGYIVFRPDYRGHAFSEGEARGAYGAPDYTIDVLNAVASLKQYPGADPNRIGMWGHSMGGYITLRAMVSSGDIKAGVVWAGVVGSYQDMIENWHGQSSAPVPERQRQWRAQLLDKFGTPEENPKFWNSISANAYLSDLSGPIQIHHGTADEEVPIEFSVKLFDQIKAAGKSAEIYTYLDDNHNLSNSLDTALARSVAFFDKHVKNIKPAATTGR